MCFYLIWKVKPRKAKQGEWERGRRESAWLNWSLLGGECHCLLHIVDFILVGYWMMAHSQPLANGRQGGDTYAGFCLPVVKSLPWGISFPTLGAMHMSYQWSCGIACFGINRGENQVGEEADKPVYP